MKIELDIEKENITFVEYQEYEGPSFYSSDDRNNKEIVSLLSDEYVELFIRVPTTLENIEKIFGKEIKELYVKKMGNKI